MRNKRFLLAFNSEKNQLILFVLVGHASFCEADTTVPAPAHLCINCEACVRKQAIFFQIIEIDDTLVYEVEEEEARGA